MRAKENKIPAADAQREECRKLFLEEAPSWYNPYAHLALTSVFGLGTALPALFWVHGLRWWEIFIVPLALLVANASEWRIHRDLLHRRSRLAPVLYEQHTPRHHRIYITEDMAIRRVEEFRLVLIPPYGILLMFLGTFPVIALLGWLVSPNVAALYAAATMGYVLCYEWLHLAYHLPEDHWIGGWRLIRKLRRHHAIHHDPRLMQRWNFNVTVPLWDWVMGTAVSDPGSVP